LDDGLDIAEQADVSAIVVTFLEMAAVSVKERAKTIAFTPTAPD
jgi:hypothetical protein